MGRLSCSGASWGHSSLRYAVSHHSGRSCSGAQALGTRASVVGGHGLSNCVSQTLERGLSGCGARAQRLHGMWNLPGSGIEPVSPALAGRFSPTVPPGKSSHTHFSITLGPLVSPAPPTNPSLSHLSSHVGHFHPFTKHILGTCYVPGPVLMLQTQTSIRLQLGPRELPVHE